MALERLRGQGLLLIPDAHVAATPPGQRLEGFREQVLAKIRACLERAQELELIPIFLGDLFHWPRENPNALLVELMDLFRPYRQHGAGPVVLVGNHDKYQARFTSDTSLAVLAAAGVATVLDSGGAAFDFLVGGRRVVVGASPDGVPLPERFDTQGDETVVWVSHHGLAFPGAPDAKGFHVRLREIPGVDWVCNGHLHRPQPTIAVGGTRYVNPGSLTRVSFSRANLTRVPAAAIWRPGAEDVELWPVPHLPFSQVFPDQEFPPEDEAACWGDAESGFLRGLERLAWRRTSEGAGLREFLNDNLDPEDPAAALILELYKEVAGGGA